MRFFLHIVIFLQILGCKVKESVQEKGLIVCSTSIVASSVQEVVGNKMRVVSLMGPGIDPHNYNPRPRDVEWLDKAEIIVYSGFHLEGKMAELFHRLRSQKDVFAIADAFPKKALIYVDEKTVDPHIWFDTENWLIGLTGVVNQIGRLHPEYKLEFDLKLNAFIQKTRHETNAMKLQLESIPFEKRVLITSHDAFHYFGNCFGIRVKALQGVSTAQEPSLRAVLDIVDFIVEHKINAIFVENSVSPKALQAVLSAVERKKYRIRIGGTLFSDALGGKDSGASTYRSMISKNVQTIYQGLSDETEH